MTGRYLAIDMGAESGRVMLGSIDDGIMTLQALHRFKTQGTSIHGRLYWNVLRFYEEIIEGIAASKDVLGLAPVNGIGVDTWGVDFVLLDAHDNIIGYPYHYRDPVMLNAYTDFLGACDAGSIYETTGIQFLPFNSIVQLFALGRQDRVMLDRARSFLMLPDYLTFLLSGHKAIEYTDASTTQLLHAGSRDWHQPLLEWLQVDPALFPSPRQPGQVLGPVAPEVAGLAGCLAGVPVHLACSHDTASAIVGCPLSSSKSAYLSSGTWSLMGVELDAPIVTRDAMAANFTNEGGAENTIDFLKNIMGLWLLQQSRRSWANRTGDLLDYDTIVSLARNALDRSMPALVQPDDPRFLNPADMVAEIRQACIDTGQGPPGTMGDLAATIFASLAMRYREVKDSMERLVGFSIDKLHVVGGGSKNTLLCQLTADALDLPVIAGPDEATSAGNVIVQAMSAGELGSISEGRRVLGASFPPVPCLPADPERWHQLYVDVYLPLAHREAT